MNRIGFGIALVLLAQVGATAVPPETAVLRFRAEVRNTHGESAADELLEIGLPLDLGGQRLTRVSGPTTPTRTAHQAGQVVAQVALPTLAPRGSVTVIVDATVTFGPNTDAGDVPPEALSSSPGIPVDDPSIIATATRVAQGEGPLDKARAIYRFVRQHVDDDGFHATDRGALYALRHRRGDCTEMAQLTVALCRAAGVPARLAHGYPISGDTLIDPASYHAFALVHDGDRWRVVDPQAGVGPDDQDRATGHVITRLDGPGDPGFHRLHASSPHLDARLVPPRDVAVARAGPRPRSSGAHTAQTATICHSREDGAIRCRPRRPDELAPDGSCQP